MTRLALLLGSICFPAAVAAADPHEHGAAQLDIAVDGRQITLALQGAGDGFVGFEHAPGTAEEHAQVERTVAALRDGARLFAFGDAVCRQTVATVTPPSGDPHRDEHHQGDEPRAGDHHDDDHVHADWRAEWQFVCDARAGMDEVQVNLFDALPRLEEIRVQFISDAGQTSATLTAESRAFETPADP